MRTQSKIMTVLIGAAVAAYFLWPRPQLPTIDEKAAHDRKIDKYIANSKTQDAIAFFESGGEHGVHIAMDGKEPDRIDRDVLFPLIMQFKEKYNADTTAIVSKDDPKWAVGLFVRLPDDAKLHKGIADDIKAADEKFPGIIVSAYGYKWLAIDALPKRVADMLEDDDEQRERLE
jgi:hypothetical protein